MWGASAQALEVHKFTGSFGSQGLGSGEFEKPHGIAVNDTTGDVYVVDQGNNRVQEFNSTGTAILTEFNGSVSPTGAFSEPTQIAVDNSGNPLMDESEGDVYVVDRGHGVIDKFDSSGTYLGQLTGVDTPGGAFEAGQDAIRSIQGVAVDPSGTLWVTVYKGPIYSFSDALVNGYSSELNTVFGNADEGLGVDSEDNLYFRSGFRIAKVNSSGAVLANPFGGDETALAVAVDPIGNEVYLDNNEANEATIEAFSLSGAPIESFGSGHLVGNTPPFSDGVAVDASNGTVYATDYRGDTVSVFEAFIQPSVGLAPLSEQQPRSLTLNGSVDPEGKPIGSCVFEYGSTSAYGQSVPCSPASLGSGTTPVAVSAQLTGLSPETVYHYRLSAENAAGKSSTPDQELHTGPVLGTEFVTDVASTSATLHDPIDPNGADTHYYIQYGPSVAYGSYAPVSPPGVDLGGTPGEQSLSVHLQGLEAGTVYHYRFVAEQAGETFEAPDRSFTTQPAGGLAASPDGRAWELVSPPDKKGALLELTELGGQVQAASDGSGITYVAEGPAGGEGPAGKSKYSQVLSRRTSDGWKSEDLTPPGEIRENGAPAETILEFGFYYHLFSPDLEVAAFEPHLFGTPPLAPEVENERTLYLRDDVNGTFSPLVSTADIPEGTKIDEAESFGSTGDEWQIKFLAATPDLSHVVFKTPSALTPEAFDEETVSKNQVNHEIGDSTVQWNLYEWSNGGLKLVNILPPPGNEVAHGRHSQGVPLVRLAGMTDADGDAQGSVQRDISADGRRIAWTWGEPFTPQKLQMYRGLYVRDMIEERTVRIGGPRAIYQTMNAEGSKIFYLEDGDLYEYDWNSGIAADLTSTHGQAEANAGVQEMVSDVSEDGSYVYFVAKGVLAVGGVSGEDNLYVLHDTGNGWDTTYIATLSEEDRYSWFGENKPVTAPYLPAVSSRVSPNGRFLVFMSERPLTGYDNTDAVSGAPDEEVFLYDAQGGVLVCASCNPSDSRPVGVFDSVSDGKEKLLVDRLATWGGANAAGQAKSHWLAGSVPGWDDLNKDPATYQPRYLSNSGRLFFDSPDGLVAQDTNGLEDVYEYEPEGVGDCTSSTSSARDVYVKELAGHPVDGCVGLISSGTSSSESVFYDASENGDDVFFDTTSKLVGEDYDKGYDVYDAHVCTSAVPCKQEPVSPPPCNSGDSCKAAPSPQPSIFGAAPSATFNGVGNLTTASAPSVRQRSLTSAQKLARALRACHKRKGKRRSACEREAHKRYPLKRVRKAAATGNGRKG
ncbi:MAG: hypothetical protein WBQ21_14205 [Solirubrobacteraceae bacterium]